MMARLPVAVYYESTRRMPVWLATQQKHCLRHHGYGYMLACCDRAADGSHGRWDQQNNRIDARRVMNRSRICVFYSGTVQGVGFRYTVRTLAGGFDVAGMVRNLPDGRVELLAEGRKDELSAFQQAIRESELGHFIQREEVIWAEPAGGLRGFEIVS
jgi:acylphosphatase